MDQTPPVPPESPATTGMYVPAGVPAVEPKKHSGMTLGIWGIISAVIALLIFPPVFGIIGIVLGVLATRKGEKAIGITAIVLSAVFMIIGWGFGIYVETHPTLFGFAGSVTQAASAIGPFLK